MVSRHPAMRSCTLVRDDEIAQTGELRRGEDALEETPPSAEEDQRVDEAAERVDAAGDGQDGERERLALDDAGDACPVSSIVVRDVAR